jgi:hypothetical protein
MEAAVGITERDALRSHSVLETLDLALSPVDIKRDPSREQLRQRGRVLHEHYKPTRDPRLGVINIGSREPHSNLAIHLFYKFNHDTHDVLQSEIAPVVRVAIDPNIKLTIGRGVASVNVVSTPGLLNFGDVFLDQSRDGKHPERILRLGWLLM